MKKMILMPHRGVKPVIVDDNTKGSLFPEVEITDDKDEALFFPLIEKVNNGDEDAIPELFRILDKYNHETAIDLLLMLGKRGEAHKLEGDDFEAKGDERNAKRHYKFSAESGYKCGKCKLGRYYAEGKGCTKNMSKAKDWLTQASQECDKVEQYLDQYDLR